MLKSIGKEQLSSNLSMYIYGMNPSQMDYQDQPIETKKPIMIMCCPNAAYYELMCIENEWVRFYIRAGVNVFIWNYRGYGRSGGQPSPGVE